MNSAIIASPQKRTDSVQLRFLLVDDHELIRFGLGQLIGQVPNWVIAGECSDASEAMKLAKEEHIDVAIVDLSLKEGSGLDLVKSLRAHLPDLKILIFSMHEESLYAERSLRSGAHGYVHKQQPSTVVMTALRHILEGKTYLSPEQTQRLLSRTTGRRKPESGSDPIDLLSDRELQIFELLGRGSTVKQIAKDLHLSAKTVEYHRGHIREKLGVGSSAEVTRQATIWTSARE